LVISRSSHLAASAALLGLIAYAVFRALVFGVVRLPPIPGGLSGLTAILTLFSLIHAWYSLGGRLTTLFFALSAGISWALEEAGVATGLVYGGYHYTEYLGPKLGHVPLLIPLAWFMMIYPSYVVANLLVGRHPIGTIPGPRALVVAAGVSAVVMTAWDLVMDPILSASTVHAWVWESGGAYFGVPVQNFVGWLVTTFTVYAAYRAVEQRIGGAALGPVDWRVGAMPVAAYGLMLAGDLMSGVTPPGIVPIGLVVMGVPLLLAVWRLLELRAADARPLEVAPDPLEA
jgi:putative membrane protein